MLGKTRMCRFYGNGSCTRGDACNFAHRPSDLQIRPDLQKTHLCMAFQRCGRCRDGPACRYAHGEQELRRRTNEVETPVEKCPGAPRRVPAPSQTEFHMLISSPKEAAIQQFLKDNNSWGEECLGTDEAFSRQSTAAPSFEGSDGNSESGSRSMSPELPSQNDSKLEAAPMPQKTFHKTKLCKFYAQGKCFKGAACGYAHQQADLQPQPDLYRTQICVAFDRWGSCKLGESCPYAHGAEQLRMSLGQDRSHVKKDHHACPCPTPPCHQDSSSLVEKPLLIGADPSAQTLVVGPNNGMVDVHLSVKNTFIHCTWSKSPKPAPQRRSKSASAYLVSTRCVSS